MFDRFKAAASAFMGTNHRDGNAELLSTISSRLDKADCSIQLQSLEKDLKALIAKDDLAAISKRLDTLEKASIRLTLQDELLKVDNIYKKSPGRWERIRRITEDALSKANISGGKMLEIGGRENPRNEDFPNFDYFALDLSQHPTSKVKVEVGDITDCKHIPDNTYDFVFSLDVFEHINRPWLAGQEITRILKPGGLTVHSTLFAWRYHPCPGDYYRYTPEGLSGLFPDLECIHSGFDYTERRRNMLGRDNNKMKPDVLGGWRENVRVNFAGIKKSQS